MSTPVTYLKPLTAEQRLLVETLCTRYEGVDAPFVKFEDDDSVTLRVPDIIRRATPYVREQEPTQA